MSSGLRAEPRGLSCRLQTEQHGRGSWMTNSEALIFVTGLLYLERRVAYRRLRKEFKFDEEVLEDVCHELIVAMRQRHSTRNPSRRCSGHHQS